MGSHAGDAMSHRSAADDDASSLLEGQSSIAERNVHDIAVGVRVRVLPGRQFPAFGAGETGVVRRLDVEARTCDVLFDGHAGGPVAVSMRHLAVERSATAMGLLAGETFMSAAHRDGKHTNGEMSGSRIDVEDFVETRVSRDLIPDLTQRRQRKSGTEEARLVDLRGHVTGRASEEVSRDVWVTATEGITSGMRSIETSTSAPHDMAAKIVNLEGRAAHQQRLLANLEARLMTVESGTTVEYESLHRKHRSTLVESERQLDEAEQRAVALRRSAAALREEMERMGSLIDVQERKANNLEEVVSSSGATVSRLGAMLEGKERRASELGFVLGKADESIGRIANHVDTHITRVSDLERRAADGVHLVGERACAELETSAGSKGKDNGPVWQALRELQELVVHESEHRAAGLREVLGVLGQGVEQLRGEQARLAEEMEGRNKEELRRAKQKFTESQMKQAEQEKRADGLDLRLDAITQALAAERVARSEAIAWVETQLRGGPALVGGEKTRAVGEVVTSQSLQRLEALEARFDVAKGEGAPQTPRAGAQVSGSDGPLYKLRGQLEGLRNELVGSNSPPRSARHSVKTVSEATLQEYHGRYAATVCARPGLLVGSPTRCDSALSSTTVIPGAALGPATTISCVAHPPQPSKGLARCASAPAVGRVGSVLPTILTADLSPRYQQPVYSVAVPQVPSQWTTGVAMHSSYSTSDLPTHVGHTTASPYIAGRALAPQAYTVSSGQYAMQQPTPALCYAAPPVPVWGEVVAPSADGQPVYMTSITQARALENLSTPNFVTYGQLSGPGSPVTAADATSIPPITPVDLFATMDANHDGVVTRAEWGQAVAQHSQIGGSVLRQPERPGPVPEMQQQRLGHDTLATAPSFHASQDATTFNLAQVCCGSGSHEYSGSHDQSALTPRSHGLAAAASATSLNGRTMHASFGAPAVEGPILLPASGPSLGSCHTTVITPQHSHHSSAG